MDFILGFDFGILDFIANNIRNESLDPVMAVLSLSAEKCILPILLGLLLLIPRKTRPAAATALFAIALGVIVGEGIIKNFVARPRPYDLYYSFHNAVMPFTLNTGKTTGFSFPSTHTICAFALATSFFKVNKKVGIVLVVLAAFVGFSRLYNYVHFPTDVIAGMLIGIAAGLLAIFIFKKFRFDDKLLGIGKGKQKS